MTDAKRKAVLLEDVMALSKIPHFVADNGKVASTEGLVASIAISLKRIADALEAIERKT